MRIVVAAFAILLSFCVLAAPAMAETNDSKPSKESLLAAWEQMQKDNPYTVAFEKTAEKSIYDFETTIFPFKGKLKVLNTLIEEDPAYYYGDFSKYDTVLPDGDYIGLVEVELPEADKEFAAKYRYSYATWEQGNALYYHADSKKWYTAEEWALYKKEFKSAKAVSAPKSACGLFKSENFVSWWPLILVIGWIVICAWFSSKQKKNYANYLNECREINKIISDRGIEALAIQKEILEVLKRKT